MGQLSAEAAVEALKKEWEPFLQVSPFLALDEKWPSIGVIDQLTFCLRLKEDVSEALEPMLKGSAAYICVVCAKAWRGFAENVEITNGEYGFELRAQGGEHLAEGELLRYPVERELRRLLIEVPFPFPVFRHVDVPLGLNSNIVSLFALGVATALGPAVEGPWERFEPEDSKPWTAAAVRHMALECAESYARLFPDEPIGQVAELYLSGLIYPPPLVGEALPFSSAVDQLVGRFKEYGFPEEKILTFGENLSLMPDETLSSAGLILVGALAEEMPSPKVLAAAETKRNYTGLLRSAMLRVRVGFAERDDWIIGGAQDDAASERYRIEKEMGFIPWLELELSRLYQAEDYERLQPLLSAMCGYEHDEAMKLIDGLLEENPGDVALRVQRVKFSMVSGDYEIAESLLRDLSSEPESEQHPRFYNLWGKCLLEKQDFHAAARQFKKARSIAEEGSVLYGEVCNNLAWSMMLTGAAEEALPYVSEAIDASPCPLTMLLNKISISWGLKHAEEVRVLRARLFALAPFDRRVFAAIGVDASALEQVLQ